MVIMLGRNRQSEDAAEGRTAREKLLSRSQILCFLIHYINEGGTEKGREEGEREEKKKGGREEGKEEVMNEPTVTKDYG